MFQRPKLAVIQGVRGHHIGRAVDVANAGFAVEHVQWREEALANEIGPWLPGNLLNQKSGHAVENVVIGIGAAKTGPERNEAQAVKDLAGGEVGAGPEHQVAGAQRQTTAMAEKIDDTHLAHDERLA